MRFRTWAAPGAIGIAVLAISSPTYAAGEGAQSVGVVRTWEVRGGMALRSIARDFLVLMSTGYSQAHMWNEATMVSRALVAMADDSPEACVAQATLVWQVGQVWVGDAAFSEWRKLHELEQNVEADQRVESGDRLECLAAYRRVTGDLIVRGQLVSDLSRADFEKIRILAAAYDIAVQPGVAAAGAAPHR
jgi:hypothetical protein